jgi:hypothetical protein
MATILRSLIIVDGHPTHRAKSVAKFVAEQAGMLELFFLPERVNDFDTSGSSF